MAEKIQLKAIKLQQAGDNKAIYITTIPVKELINKTQFKIDEWDPAKKGDLKNQGYQRRPMKNRISKIASFINRRPNAILPTSILISARKGVDFNPENSNIGILEFNKFPAYIVDGQHRIEGLAHYSNELQGEEWLNKDLPVVVLDGFDKIDEIKQFFILNNEAKKVATDLAERLLGDIAIQDGEQMQELIGNRSDWKLRAIKVIDMLNEKEDSPWYKKIRLPNSDKLATHIVNQTSFLKSLQPVFRDGALSAVRNADDCYDRLKSYWLAVKKIFPDAFSDPRQYVIQKTPGVFSLHQLANHVMLSGGNEKTSVNDYSSILGGVFGDGEFDDDFWRASNDDGASRYGSMKGFRILADWFVSKLNY